MSERDDDFEDWDDDADYEEWDDNDDDDYDDGDSDDVSDHEAYSGMVELDPALDQGDEYEPDWWEDGMPDEWWDYYGDDYVVDEFEIAIDY